MDWDKLNRLFHEVLSLDVSERPQFIDRNCEGDTQLRAELEALIETAEISSEQLKSPVTLFNSSQWGKDSEDAFLGREVGVYRLERYLGGGGFGRVYLAQRTDDIEHYVAIKILRSVLLGRAVLRRFEIERQVLARLDHPGIARLIDGGTTDDGYPYIVMDYVDGVPIDQHCKAQGLDVEQRIRIFERVCAAVGYAHQFGIIHRDLKPANILVAKSGEPKLIDFGIARLSSAEHPYHDSTLTKMGAMPLTPDYASPEQVRGEQVGLTSDVYSLGILLYRLLTRTRPYSLSNRSPQEIERTVCDQAIPRPSHAVLNTSHEIDLSRSERIRLARRLAGDLDTMVLMATHKEATRRYRSAAEFQEDIQRFLDGRAVAARSDSVIYRAQKFVARNRVIVAASVLLLLSLVGGLAATATAWRAAWRLANQYEQQLSIADARLAFDASQNGRATEVQAIVEKYNERLSSRNRDAADAFEWQVLRSIGKRPKSLWLRGHNASVSEVAAVPGKPWIVSVGEDCTLPVWDTNTGREVFKFDERHVRPEGAEAETSWDAVAVSPDGRYVATGGSRIHLWDLAERTHVRQVLECRSNAESIAFSSDGRRLLIGARYHDLILLDLADDTVLQRHDRHSRFETLAFTEESLELFSPWSNISEADGERTELIVRWDAQLKAISATYEQDAPRHFALSHNQKWLAACSQYAENINLFDCSNSNVLSSIPIDSGRVAALTFSPNDQLLAAGMLDGSVQIWPLIDRLGPDHAPTIDHELRRIFQAHQTEITDILFLEDRRLVTVSKDAKICVWTLGPPLVERIGPVGLEYGMPQFEDELELLVDRTRHGEVLVVDVDRGTPIIRRPVPLTAAAAISPDGEMIAYGDSRIDILAGLQNEGKPPFQSKSVWTTTGEESVAHLAFSRDGDLLAAAIRQHRVCVFDLQRNTRTWWALPIEPKFVAWGPHRLLAMGGHGTHVEIRKAVGGASPPVRIKTTTGVTQLAWSNEGRFLAIGMQNGSILLYDRQLGRSSLLSGHPGMLRALCFSPDERTLLSGDHGSIRLWSTETGRAMGTMFSTAKTVTGLTFSKDGRNLFIATETFPPPSRSGRNLLKWRIQ